MASPVAAGSPPVDAETAERGAERAEKILVGLRPLGFALFRHGKGMSDVGRQQLTLKAPNEEAVPACVTLSPDV
jgi:hypothetical protein